MSKKTDADKKREFYKIIAADPDWAFRTMWSMSVLETSLARELALFLEKQSDEIDGLIVLDIVDVRKRADTLRRKASQLRRVYKLERS